MFQLVAQPYRILFFTLIILWATAFVIGMIRGRPDASVVRRLPVASRIVMIAITLIVAGIWWFGFAAWTTADHYALWIALGLTAGAVGDLILADLFPFKRSEIPALIVFGAGHIFYLIGIFSLRSLLGLVQTAPVVSALIVSAALMLAGWTLWVRNPHGRRSLNIASLIYGLLLFVTAGLAVETAIEAGAVLPLALGLTLFAISDIMLAQYLIRQRSFRLIRDIVWIIYSGGQMLIAFSIGSALTAISV
jgi:hypothetical protein